jgi:hypothetical protein
MRSDAVGRLTVSSSVSAKETIGVGREGRVTNSSIINGEPGDQKSNGKSSRQYGSWATLLYTAPLGETDLTKCRGIEN